jgi:superfamily II DNA or RNA helicase
MKLTVEKISEVHLRIYGDPGCEQELEMFFTYEVPGARFTPKFKARLWDGKIRLYSIIRKTLYVGLFNYLVEFCKRNNYELNFHSTDEFPRVYEPNDYTIEDTTDFIKALNMHARGEPIPARDYQIEAVNYALNANRTVLLSPTASGKSFMIYCLLRHHLEEGRKCIIVVPTTSLVEQMHSDFKDYSSNNGFEVEERCQKLYSGFTRVFSKDVLITTWQSIYKQPKDWFENFDVIIGDEAHQFKATSLITIMERMQHVKYRIGTTGTIDDKQLSQLTLEGLFGPVHRVITTKELMDQGSVVKIDISCLMLQYSDDIRKACKDFNYQKEIDFIIANEARNKFITNLALKQKGITLVLFRYIEKHGDILYSMLKNKAPEATIHYVHGGVNTLDREDIRISSEASTENVIILASYATFSTGINIRGIENVIFASPTKSKITNLQSIGRGLRLKHGKSLLRLYDIADDLQHKSHKNHTINHMLERVKIYSEEKFPYKIYPIKL